MHHSHEYRTLRSVGQGRWGMARRSGGSGEWRLASRVDAVCGPSAVVGVGAARDSRGVTLIKIPTRRCTTCRCTTCGCTQRADKDRSRENRRGWRWERGRRKEKDGKTGRRGVDTRGWQQHLLQANKYKLFFLVVFFKLDMFNWKCAFW